MSDETILQEAQRLVYGPRQESYGHPFDDFSKTGQMWGAILSKWRASENENVPPELVALCQIAVKISREVNASKRDNIVDLAGYAGTLALVRERQDEELAAAFEAVRTLEAVRKASVPVGFCGFMWGPFKGDESAKVCILPEGHSGWHGTT